MITQRRQWAETLTIIFERHLSSLNSLHNNSKIIECISEALSTICT